MANLLRGKGILAGARDAQLLHAEVKRRPLDSQSRGGPVWTGDNPPGLLKNLANVVSLRIFQSHGLQRFRFRRSPQARERWAQDISGGEDYASLDEILELTNVPGPLVCDERRHRFLWNVFDLLIHAASINLDKVLHQCRNVSAAHPQRWQRNREYIQTVIEVAAKFAPLHHVHQISVGRGDQTNVHSVSSSTAQALEFLFLQDTQQFGLQSRRNISHLVQEERPFIRQFEAANLLRDSTSESASLMAEELAFQ